MSILKVEGLSKEFGGQIVLNKINFSIEEKGVYAILGKKGHGKSVLAALLAGCYEADEGIVAYNDTVLDPNDKKSKRLKKKIGYVPEICFFPADMTVFELLDFTGKMRGVSPDKRSRQIKEALELLLLTEKREALVKGLTVTEKKRLSFANALVGNPSVLILDEPIANASAEDAELIKDLISMLGEKKVIIILTDRTSDADALASQIGIMSDGELVLWESLEQIKLKLDGDRNALLKTFLAFTDGAREA